jgi:hypothetical protein
MLRRAAGAEIRNPNIEIRNNIECQRKKLQTDKARRGHGFVSSDLGFVSDFDIRFSDLLAYPA